MFIVYSIASLITEYYLRENLNIDTNICGGTLRWSHSSNDHGLRIEYNISRHSLQNNGWVYEDMTSVGNVTQYTFSQCVLQPGRFYQFYIRSNVLLTNPNETFYIDSLTRNVVMGMYWFMFLNVILKYYYIFDMHTI